MKLMLRRLDKKPMLPGKWHGRTYGYVVCSACDRMVADHTYDEAKACLKVLEG